MGAKTEISWTDATWNPVRGCSRVSEGCRRCYAERLAARNLPGLSSPVTGLPYAAVMADGLAHWTGRVELIESALELPLRWRKPRKIFVNSMSDLFHESLSEKAIDRVFGVMARAREHTFQVLTKRPERMLAYLQRFRPDGEGFVTRDGGEYTTSGFIGNPARWPLPNVWLGVSVENQATADARIPQLLLTPAAVRFVSAEPLLGPISVAPFLPRPMHLSEIPGWALNDGCTEGKTRGLDWVIVGGESGPGARPCNVAWIRSIVRQCKAADVACFVKQFGANVYGCNDDGFEGDTPTSWPMDTRYRGVCNWQGFPVHVLPHDRKGGDPAEWPEDLRVRELPEVPRG
jgi:protein gp37